LLETDLDGYWDSRLFMNTGAYDSNLTFVRAVQVLFE